MSPTLAHLTTAAVSPELREALIDCWTAVSNAGGAVGFPFPPVDATHVAPVADELISGLAPQRSGLVVARHDGGAGGVGHRPA